MSKTTQEGLGPQWTIADRLRKSREQTGLSQSEFADEIEISRGTVSNYEKTRKRPLPADSYKRPYMLAWALGTGVSLEWLYGTVKSLPEIPTDEGGGSTGDTKADKVTVGPNVVGITTKRK